MLDLLREFLAWRRAQAVQSDERRVLVIRTGDLLVVHRDAQAIPRDAGPGPFQSFEIVQMAAAPKGASAERVDVRAIDPIDDRLDIYPPITANRS